MSAQGALQSRRGGKCTWRTKFLIFNPTFCAVRPSTALRSSPHDNASNPDRETRHVFTPAELRRSASADRFALSWSMVRKLLLERTRCDRACPRYPPPMQAGTTDTREKQGGTNAGLRCQAAVDCSI
eukprot:2274022-Rhodomonas_salina.3